MGTEFTKQYRIFIRTNIVQVIFVIITSRKNLKILMSLINLYCKTIKRVDDSGILILSLSLYVQIHLHIMNTRQDQSGVVLGNITQIISIDLISLVKSCPASGSRWSQLSFEYLWPHHTFRDISSLRDVPALCLLSAESHPWGFQHVKRNSYHCLRTHR